MERRKAARYGLHVPVLFSWDENEPKQAGGFTRDVSVSGAYVICEQGETPALGETVTVQLMLPLIDEEAHGLKLKSQGHVLRSGESKEESGFAVLAEFGVEPSTGNTYNAQDGVPS